MERKQCKWLFDDADEQLLNELDSLFASPESDQLVSPLFEECFHPRGIKELAAPEALRIAVAVFRLLHFSRQNETDVKIRLAALQALHDELIAGLNVPMRRNTARVVLQILKNLVRETGNQTRRMMLAHDLRTALQGRPRFIRALLKQYHLLEMPENWNQVSFDSHVHDMNTKGRKSPSHLMLSAWVKGIRQLQVIYYDFVPRMAAEELLRAAAILNIDVRIGIEFHTAFYERYAILIWTPSGFSGAADFLQFLDSPKVMRFTEKCREVVAFREKQVLETLDEFNQSSLEKLQKWSKTEISPISRQELLESVHYGQLTLSHLAELLSARIQEQLRAELTRNPETLQQRAALQIAEEATPEFILGHFINQERLTRMPDHLEDLPELSRYSPDELIEELRNISTSFHMTLTLSGLKLYDVIEILFHCRGGISSLELFNLKDMLLEPQDSGEAINALREALNSGDVIKLKYLVMQAISELEADDLPGKALRIKKLHDVLCHLVEFCAMYSQVHLLASIGTDSSSHSTIVNGMGIVVLESLPKHVQRMLQTPAYAASRISGIHTHVCRIREYDRDSESRWKRQGGWGLKRRCREEWIMKDAIESMNTPQGNLVLLGWYAPSALKSFCSQQNALSFMQDSPKAFPDAPECRNANGNDRECYPVFRYMNSNLLLLLKVLIGFIPAFITFYFCGEWWVLTWFGAIIWLGVTGIRNIFQAFLSGGFCRKKQLLRWNDFISWGRIADSLMYTGLSVPLLEYGVKTLLLRNTLQVTVESSPWLVFLGIALVNGIYIYLHNIFRGFSKAVAYGNFFRSVLSVPLALVFNWILYGILLTVGIEAVVIAAILQQWAAIISKLASDAIAAFIEGFDDRIHNIQARMRDYRQKLRKVFEYYADMEVMFPDEVVLKKLRQPRKMLEELKSHNHVKLYREVLVNALDLLYFYLYQPQARYALKKIITGLNEEERKVFFGSLLVLTRKKEISIEFINGLTGRNFSQPLAFYLHNYQKFLADMASIHESGRFPFHRRDSN